MHSCQNQSQLHAAVAQISIAHGIEEKILHENNQTYFEGGSFFSFHAWGQSSIDVIDSLSLSISLSLLLSLVPKAWRKDPHFLAGHCDCITYRADTPCACLPDNNEAMLFRSGEMYKKRKRGARGQRFSSSFFLLFFCRWIMMSCVRPEREDLFYMAWAD